MKVGVKFCGGCNPRYDRRSVLNRLLEDCPALCWSYAKPEEAYDVLLVLCGCPSRCADVSAFHAETVLTVAEPADYGNLYRFFSQKLPT